MKQRPARNGPTAAEILGLPPETDGYDTGRHARKLRLGLGLTMAQLAMAIGRPTNATGSISDWENGQKYCSRKAAKYLKERSYIREKSLTVTRETRSDHHA